MKRLIDSFKYAFDGLIFVVKNEKNFRIHFLVALLVILVSFLLKLEKYDFIIIIILIFLVIILELIDTALEKTLDFVSKKRNPTIRAIKDIIAGAVLLSVILSIIIGLLIFVLYLDKIFL